MNATSEKPKNGKRAPQALGFDLDGTGSAPDQYHEHELRSIAAFRLRDAANRIAMLVSMTRSAELQAELLEMYDRLVAEERQLLVRSVRVVHLGAASAASRVTKRTA